MQASIIVLVPIGLIALLFPIMRAAGQTLGKNLRS